jgi:hypothetical protein
MENENSHNSIRQAVLDKIKSGKVRKLPRAYFILRVIATILVSLLLLVVSAFVFSFMLFSFHESGEQFLIGFGFEGILAFLMLFPWALFTLDILLLLILEWLLQGFKFGYRIPLLNFGVGIFVASFVVGGLINLTPVQSILLQRADNNQLPLVGDAYEHIFDRHEDQGVCRGIVTMVNVPGNPGGFIMQHNDRDHDTDDGQFIVTLAPGVPAPQVVVGDRVLVFGHPNNTQHVEAHNVQVLDPVYPQ